ncbi:MAG: transporter [Fimbriiglobus sp.]
MAPEMALILQMTVPSGSRDFSAREVLPGVNLLYGWDVIKDRVSVGGSTQANSVRGDFEVPDFMGLGQAVTGKHTYLLLAQSLTVNYTLTEKLGAYTEWFAFFPHSAIGPDIGPEHYLDGGFTYKLTPTFQLDIRAGMGLNRHAADFFAGSGFAVKY